MKLLYLYKELFKIMSAAINVCKVGCLFLLFMSSCKKEQPEYPYTEIVNFTINDAAGQSLKGVVEKDEIIVYWPPAQTVPDSIIPIITVAERASVQPASGTKIPFTDGASFTVTAQNGEVKVYKIRQVLNIPKPYIKELSGINTYQDKNFVVIGNTISAVGDYFNTDTLTTKAYLLRANGEEIPLSIDGISAIRMDLRVETPGDYIGLKLISDHYSITIDREVSIIEDSLPLVDPLTAPVTLRRGEIFHLKGKNLDKVTAMNAANMDIFAFIPMTIKTVKGDEMEVQVPLDFPVGKYHILSFDYGESDYFAASTGYTWFDDVNIIDIVE